MTVLPIRAKRPDLTREERLAWLRLSRTENVGPLTFYRLLEKFGTALRALESLPDFSAKSGSRKPMKIPPADVVMREYDALLARGGDILLACDNDYPIGLASIEDAPPVLSFLGDKDLLKKPALGIVGARNASLNGRRFAEKLAADLGGAGYVVVSGLARGIDTAAHAGSLATVAVVAGGVVVIYPQENAALYDRIAESGLVLAESPLGTQPVAQSFPRRNRIVSGLSLGIVVVEASLKSGSLITARLAAEQGRDVFAVPGFPLDPRAQGPNALIRDGAILIQGAEDVLGQITGFSAPPAKTETQPMLELVRNEAPAQDVQALVLEQLSAAPVSIDDLVRSSGLNVTAINAVLMELELDGQIQRLHGGRVSLC